MMIICVFVWGLINLVTILCFCAVVKFFMKKNEVLVEANQQIVAAAYKSLDEFNTALTRYKAVDQDRMSQLEVLDRVSATAINREIQIRNSIIVLLDKYGGTLNPEVRDGLLALVGD